MALAILARVLPVQGATTTASSMLLGPKGSASTIVVMGSFPVISLACLRKSVVFPKRVSVPWDFSENIVYTLAFSFTSLSI